MKNWFAFGATISVLSSPMVAHAASFSAAGAFLGSTSFEGTSLATATKLTFSNSLFDFTNIPTLIKGSPNQLSGIIESSDYGTVITTLPISGFAPITSFLTFGPSNRFSLSLNSIALTSNDDDELTVNGFGVLKDADLSNPINSTDVKLKLTLQDVFGAISASLSFGGTVAPPPVVETPPPVVETPPPVVETPPPVVETPPPVVETPPPVVETPPSDVPAIKVPESNIPGLAWLAIPMLAITHKKLRQNR